MASNDLPWNQTPGYLAVSSRFIALGGRTTYGNHRCIASSLDAAADVLAEMPRQEGSTPFDKTSFHPGCDQPTFHRISSNIQTNV